VTFSALDFQCMSRALQLAEHGRYTTRPNPRVGCVIAFDGEIIAEGYHYRAGEPHAEIHALQAAEKSGKSVKGATVYVTLEPCSHQGRTGACAIALAEAGVARVVYAVEDPNPKVSGNGLQILRDAGVAVDGPLLEAQAITINRGFIKRMQQQRPWVTCKLAASLDGRTAMASGESQWITGSAARQDVQRLRAQSCAVVTGIGSIEQDNSRLNLRAEELPLPNVEDILALPPLRVVLDSDLKMTAEAAILAAAGKVVVFTSEKTSQQKIAALLSSVKDSPVKSELVVETIRTTNNGVDLEQMLQRLAKKYECNEVLVEAGAILAGSILQAGLMDECVLYQAPVLMGSDARPLLALPIETMAEKIDLEFTDMRQLGDDLRITFYPKKV
jgi:diaminohydroxyphosphoribosylaminopyrimidine deaminase/5-amino-6-(5-phosphoribosylamino)uracil reductase